MSTAIMLGLIVALGILAFRARDVRDWLGPWHAVALVLIGLIFMYFGLTGDGRPYVDFFFALLAFGLALQAYRETRPRPPGTG